MAYTNSPLADLTLLSDKHSGERTHSIDRITPHCLVGQASVENLANYFYTTTRECSCNYGIGTEGKVALVVEEKNRSWCSSSNANDQRAVTVECASDKTHPYAFNEAVYEKLVLLCADICKRNGKTKVVWIDDKEKALAYTPAEDEMQFTVHRWFANKSCPGAWLYERMPDLTEKVNALLGEDEMPEEGEPEMPSEPEAPETPAEPDKAPADEFEDVEVEIPVVAEKTHSGIAQLLIKIVLALIKLFRKKEE